MKFLCDRCKTRYSIADERVRGKILKIRCKNCSAVISVREGMDEPTEWSAPPVVEPVPTIPGAGAAPAATAPPVLAPVRPPASLQEEWYVSLDGNQEGPFSLPEAQAWISSKGPDDELHCWSEGFDDWLPVEKVSHFRGLRGKVTRARPPTRPGGVEARAEYAPSKPAEPEPKPLFAATFAAIEADAASAPAPAPKPEAAPPPKPAAAALKPLSSMKAGTGANPAVAAKGGTGSNPAVAPARPTSASTPPAGVPMAMADSRSAPLAPLSPNTPTPPVGVPVASVAAAVSSGASTSFRSMPAADPGASGGMAAAPPAVPARPARPGPTPTTTIPGTVAAPPLPAAAANRPHLPRPGGTGPRPQISPSGASSTSMAAAGASASMPAAPLGARPPLPLGTPAPASRPAPSFDTGEHDAGDNGASAPPMDDDGPANDPAGGVDEDDLQIGEVSRVVRLADIANQVPARRAAAQPRNATASTAAIARGTGAVSSMNQAAGAAAATGAAGPAAAATAAAPGAAPDQEHSIYAALATAQPRRRTALYAGLAAVAVVIVAVVAVVVTSGGGNADEGELQTAKTRNYDDLGFNVEDPANPRPATGAGTASAPVPDKGTNGTAPATGRRNPTGGTGSRPPNPTNGTGAASNPPENSQIGPDGMPIRPLTPDDVFAMSNKMEIGTRRCYERALKEDPFLKVSKIKATITVTKAGSVSSVVLSSMQGTPLATCLTAAIGRWRFRPSTEGIVSEFALVFEQR